MCSRVIQHFSCGHTVTSPWVYCSHKRTNPDKVCPFARDREQTESFDCGNQYVHIIDSAANLPNIDIVVQTDGHIVMSAVVRTCTFTSMALDAKFLVY